MAVSSPLERRLLAALNFLNSVSEMLATGLDVPTTFDRVAEAAVPAIFEAIAIEGWAQGLDPVVVQRGALPDSTTLASEMVARGANLGTVRAHCGSGRSVDHIDRAVLSDLSARMALVLDRESLYAQEHLIASTLQRALLPERLPHDAKITCSAAYLPGVGDVAVGGDWYDVFRLGDGRVAFSVGDVAGHGLAAAVIMGEVRQAVRAAAVNPKACELVLERANTILNMRTEPIVVTAIFGIYNPDDGRVTYATAGHPRPILALEDGSAYVLPGKGIPLGVDSEIGSRDWTFTMPPGSRLVLYTDGLIEHSRDAIAGEAELVETAGAEIGSPKERQAHRIIGRIFAGRDNVDDVAVLVLASNGQPSPTFSFDFTAVPVGVPILRHAMARFAAGQGLANGLCSDLLMAVGEAAANAVEHAYSTDEPGMVHVRAWTKGSRLAVTVSDTGVWKPSLPREERGNGIRIMRALSEKVELRIGQGQTTIALTMKCDRAG